VHAAPSAAQGPWQRPSLSQETPAPVQVDPLQHGRFTVPQATHTLLPLHRSPLALHTEPVQQVCPSPPHCRRQARVAGSQTWPAGHEPRHLPPQVLLSPHAAPVAQVGVQQLPVAGLHTSPSVGQVPPRHLPSQPSATPQAAPAQLGAQQVLVEVLHTFVAGMQGAPPVQQAWPTAPQVEQVIVAGLQVWPLGHEPVHLPPQLSLSPQAAVEEQLGVQHAFVDGLQTWPEMAQLPKHVLPQPSAAPHALPVQSGVQHVLVAELQVPVPGQGPKHLPPQLSSAPQFFPPQAGVQHALVAGLQTCPVGQDPEHFPPQPSALPQVLVLLHVGVQHT
jgi:hypothetical protein